MGNLFAEERSYQEAIACYSKALSIRPGDDSILFHLGLAYQDHGVPRLAAGAYEDALKTNPDAVTAMINLGTVYQTMGQHGAALRWYRKAHDRSPDNPVIHVNMGTAQAFIGQHEKATRCYEAAVAIHPDYEKAVCYLFKQYQRECDWENAHPIGLRLDRMTRDALQKGTRPQETPFVNISRHADPALNYAVARAWSRKIASGTALEKSAYLFRQPSALSHIIRIGYVSNTFCNHPGAQLILRLFGIHDRQRFAIYCYSYGKNDGSRYRRTIEADADLFVDISNLTDLEAADRIYADKIDILVDLRGFTLDGRLGIFACRPAPIQVTYLGYPGTTGASFMDYIICDAIIAPMEHQRWFAEHLVHLPHCYQINDDRQPMTNRIPQRKTVGLPEEGTVFCSFNTHYKIESVMFDAWMKILDLVPDSVLWLLDGGPRVRSHLTQWALRQGVLPDRIIFAEKVPKKEHLARLQLADLGLDTRIYGGHTTTTDALWAGLPVVALIGNHFASRVSASILTAAGLSELVVNDLDAYVDLAVSLGRNGQRLQKLRNMIRENRSTAPIFHTRQTVRYIEAAYDEMWTRYCHRRPMAPIVIAPR